MRSSCAGVSTATLSCAEGASGEGGVGSAQNMASTTAVYVSGRYLRVGQLGSLPPHVNVASRHCHPGEGGGAGSDQLAFSLGLVTRR
eukprot:8640496-Pyramimonas_sp.AAC.1